MNNVKFIKIVNAHSNNVMLEKLNHATEEIANLQNKIKEAEYSIDEYSKLIPELKKLGYYTSVSCCARNLMKQADLIDQYQKTINHIEQYIKRLLGEEN